MQLINIEKSLGLLKKENSKATIPYEAFEFSAQLVGLLSVEELNLHESVLLESPRNGVIKFRVMMKEDVGRMYRYRIRCVDESINLPDCLEIDPFTGKIRYDRRDNRLQYARFEAEQKIIVQTKLFGSFNYYNLQTIDVSRTGALLCAPEPRGLIPFREDTLLELRLNLSENHELSPLAKVARLYSRGKGTSVSRFFGVKFVEFHEDDMRRWSKVIHDIERKNFGTDRSLDAA